MKSQNRKLINIPKAARLHDPRCTLRAFSTSVTYTGIRALSAQFRSCVRTYCPCPLSQVTSMFCSCRCDTHARAAPLASEPVNVLKVRLTVTDSAQFRSCVRLCPLSQVTSMFYSCRCDIRARVVPLALKSKF